MCFQNNLRQTNSSPNRYQWSLLVPKMKIPNHFYKPQQWAYFVCVCLFVWLDLLWVVLIQFVLIGTFQHPDTAFELLVIPNIYDLATKLQQFCFYNGFYLAFSREETSHHNLRLFRNVVCREWEFVSSFGGKFRREFCILLREKSRATKVYLWIHR